MKESWIAVDWGTTNFRAFLISDAGVCIDKIQDKKGLLSVPQDKFPATFNQLIYCWNEEFGSLPVIMAGMVGSQQGWINAPYVETPASIECITNNLSEVTLLSGDKAKVVAGISCKNGFGNYEVMRGEEVQLFGLSELVPHDFTAILYGTHSKHAYWRNGKINSYSTVMTGELFSLLVNNSILGKSLPEQKFNKSAFIKGVELGKLYPLNHILFSARTTNLFNELKEEYIHCYISGMLIGHEFSITSESEILYLIGSKSLSMNYQIALSYLNIDYEFVDGDLCFLKGMTKIFNTGVFDE